MTTHALMELADRLEQLTVDEEMNGYVKDKLEAIVTQLRTAAAEGGECSKCAARDARTNAIYRGPANPDAAREHLLDRRLVAEPTDSGAGRDGER